MAGSVNFSFTDEIANTMGLSVREEILRSTRIDDAIETSSHSPQSRVREADLLSRRLDHRRRPHKISLPIHLFDDKPHPS